LGGLIFIRPRVEAKTRDGHRQFADIDEWVLAERGRSRNIPTQRSNETAKESFHAFKNR
jgi:hypothetical protein